MARSKKNLPNQSQGVTVLFVFLLLVAVILFWPEILSNLSTIRADAFYTILPAVMVAYVSSGAAFAVLAGIFTKNTPFEKLFVVGLLSKVLHNTLVSNTQLPVSALHSAGITDRPLTKELLFSASFVYSYLNHIMLFLFLPLSFFYLFNKSAQMQAVTAQTTNNGSWSILVPLMLALLIISIFRKQLFRSMHRLSKQFFPTKSAYAAEHFDRHLADSMVMVNQQSFSTILSVAFTVLSWVLSMMVLQFCLYSLGLPVGFLTVLAGFTVGTIVGFFSPVPGGLGFQELIVAIVLHMLGIPLITAFVAVLLYRIVYCLIPLLISLLAYPKLLKLNAD